MHENLPESRAKQSPLRALAKWDQDGSALTDIIDQNETCTSSIIEDDPEAVAQMESIRGLSKWETMKDF
jgi:hypothetical protein